MYIPIVISIFRFGARLRRLSEGYAENGKGRKKMKITVRPFLTLRPVMRNRARIEQDVDDMTLRELLDRLCEEFGDDLKNQVYDSETRAVSDMLKVLINGRHYSTLPNRLDTILRDNDEVALFPPVAGG